MWTCYKPTAPPTGASVLLQLGARNVRWNTEISLFPTEAGTGHQDLKGFINKITFLCKVQITSVTNKNNCTTKICCILVCVDFVKNVELNKSQFLDLWSARTVTVTTLSFRLPFPHVCCLGEHTHHACWAYGSCVCVLAGRDVGERCLSTNISACFRYWSVRLITDSLRVRSGSPGWTDTAEGGSQALHTDIFNPRENTTKNKKNGKTVSKSFKSAICCYF